METCHGRCNSFYLNAVAILVALTTAVVVLVCSGCFFFKQDRTCCKSKICFGRFPLTVLFIRVDPSKILMDILCTFLKLKFFRNYRALWSFLKGLIKIKFPADTIFYSLRGLMPGSVNFRFLDNPYIRNPVLRVWDISSSP